jgi:hypothetical protein
MMRGDAIAKIRPGAPPRPRTAIAAGALLILVTTLLAACSGQTGSTPGSLPKPVLVAVGEVDAAPDTVLNDPGFAARISQRMSGLTGYSVGRETAARAGATVRAQLVASLRAGGLPAEAADTENPRGDIVTLLIVGRLRSLDEAVMRQRKLAPIGAGRIRVVADIKVVHATTGFDTKTVLSFEAEDNAPPAQAGRQSPAAPAATPVGGQEPLSPDVDAHMRRIANAAAERILATAAEQGWTKGSATTRTAR